MLYKGIINITINTFESNSGQTLRLHVVIMCNIRISRLSGDAVLVECRTGTGRGPGETASCPRIRMCSHTVCILTPEVKWACRVFTSQCGSKDEWIWAGVPLTRLQGQCKSDGYLIQKNKLISQTCSSTIIHTLVLKLLFLSGFTVESEIYHSGCLYDLSV